MQAIEGARRNGNSRASGLSLALKKAAWAYRLATAPMRLLPDFIVIGTAKGGTTSLYSYLAQHPFILPAVRKEVRFFDDHFHRGLTWYRAFFATQAVRRLLVQRSRSNVVTGESSPFYLYHPVVAERVHRALPRAKLIVLLRNPIDRAYSYYHHSIRHRREDRSFEAAIAEELARPGPVIGVPKRPVGGPLRRPPYPYLSPGIYVEQLQAWARFFPREQFLVLRSEDFFADPSRVFAKVLEFLGIQPWQPPHFQVFNDGVYSPMDARTRAQLSEYFRPHNQRLYEYLGVNLGWD